MKIKLVKLPDESSEFDNSKVIITGEINTLDEALELYEDFLRACGFSLMGDLITKSDE
jgi:hypothetical protein